jgi:hypothetical protein
MAKFCVTSAHGDVIEEHLCFRGPTHRMYSVGGPQNELGALTGTTVHDQHRITLREPLHSPGGHRSQWTGGSAAHRWDDGRDGVGNCRGQGQMCSA